MRSSHSAQDDNPVSLIHSLAKPKYEGRKSGIASGPGLRFLQLVVLGYWLIAWSRVSCAGRTHRAGMVVTRQSWKEWRHFKRHLVPG
jgi:hypothetical protein